MGRFPKFLCTMAAAAIVATGAEAAPIGYTFDVTTTYQGGCGPGIDLGQCGSPDTAFLILRNNGLSNFTGTISLTGVAPSQTINLSFLSGLAASSQVTF